MQEVRLCKLISFWPALPLGDTRGRLQGWKRKKGLPCSFLFAACGLPFCSPCLWASPNHTVPLGNLGFFPRQQLRYNLGGPHLITPSSGTPVLASSTLAPGVVSLPSSKLRDPSASQAAALLQICEFQLSGSFLWDFNSFLLLSFSNSKFFPSFCIPRSESCFLQMLCLWYLTVHPFSKTN